MKNLIAQIMKFGVVGVIAFVIDYGVMVFLTEVFGLNPVVSATISFIVSVIFNYIASMRYVFSHKEGMSRSREFVIFIVLSVIASSSTTSLCGQAPNSYPSITASSRSSRRLSSWCGTSSRARFSSMQAAQHRNNPHFERQL